MLLDTWPDSWQHSKCMCGNTGARRLKPVTKISVDNETLGKQITRSDPRLKIDYQIVTFLIYTKPLITLGIFILCYTKPNLLLSQMLRLAIAYHI